MKNVYFAVVDEYVVDADTGALRVNNPDRSSKVCVNRPARTDANGVFFPAACRSVDAREDGIYVISEKDQFFKEKVAGMKEHVERSDGKIIGPFDTIAEALVAREAARPKTAEEKLKARIAELEAEVAAKSTSKSAKPEPKPSPTTTKNGEDL